MYRLLSNIKLLFVPSGRRPRRIKSGIFKGLKIELDLKHQTQLYLGLWECELYKWVARLSLGINCAIDIGAGEGEYTLYFLAKTRAKKVFAFEPSVSSQTHLMSNLKLNGFADDKRLEFSSKYVGSVNNENECTLDSLLSFVSPPALIKIDVDGSEVKILQGANEFLDLSNICWIVETHSRELEEECMRIFNQANYTTLIVPKLWWRIFIPELRPLLHNRWLVATNVENFYETYNSLHTIH